MVSSVVAHRESKTRIFIEMKASHRSTWQAISPAFRANAIENGERALALPWPSLPFSLYRQFVENGNRTNYETPYFERRRMLGSLVLAECVEHRGRFMAQIVEGIWTIIGEPTWVIPAHNKYGRDIPAHAFPLTGRPVLDLFSCDTAALLSLSALLLEEELAAWAGSQIIESIHHQLHERLVAPYLNDHSWWMGGTDDLLNNWTPWCTQNVLLTALTMGLETEERTRLITKAASSLDHWLDHYGEDGCCDEGASYWRAAGLCLWGSLHLLEAAIGEDVASLYKESKIRNIASYITNVHIVDELYLNFADCSPRAGILGAREYLFGKALDDPALMRRALEDFKAHPFDSGNGEYNLFYRLLRLMHGQRLLDEKLPPPSPPTPFIWYPSVGLAIYRKGGYTLAVKAGDNDDSHNHNDVGSIILYDGAKPRLIDMGVETYTKTTFNDERYTLHPMQSHYHNVANFPPYGQEAGAAYKAHVISVSDSSIDLELNEAYAKEAGVARYRRSVAIDDTQIVVSERTEARHAPLLTLMTVDHPRREASALIFEGWKILFDRPVEATIEAIAIDDERLRQAWPDTLYRTTVAFEGEVVWTVRRTND